jgi:hypothetical protein
MIRRHLSIQTKLYELYIFRKSWLCNILYSPLFSVTNTIIFALFANLRMAFLEISITWTVVTRPEKKIPNSVSKGHNIAVNRMFINRWSADRCRSAKTTNSHLKTVVIVLYIDWYVQNNRKANTDLPLQSFAFHSFGKKKQLVFIIIPTSYFPPI